MSRAVAVTMLKGGTTKSTITAHVAEALGRAGERALAIDTDPNGHLTVNLGYDDYYHDPDADLGDIILSEGDDSTTPADVIVDTDLGFDLLPAAATLETTETRLHDEPQPSLCMQYGVVQPLLGSVYDYIVIDTHSSRNALVNNAAVAAPNLLVPLVPDQGSFSGLRRTRERIIDPLQNRLGLEVLAFVPNRLQTRLDWQTMDRTLIERLCRSDTLASRVPNFAWVAPTTFDAMDDPDQHSDIPKPGIRKTSAIDKAFQQDMTLGAYDPGHDQLAAFDELADIVMRGGVQR